MLSQQYSSIYFALYAAYLSSSPEQMLLLLPLGPDRAWGLWLHTNTIVSSFGSFFILLLIFPSLSHILSPFHFLLSSLPPLSTQVVDCRIISSLLACLYDGLQHAVPIHKSDHFSQTAAGGKEGGSWRLNVLSVLTSVPVKAALKHTRGAIICMPLTQNKLLHITNSEAI